MKLRDSVPTNIVAGILIFIGLLFGGYFVGSTHAVSTSPTYITDSSGSNAASVSSQGHLSVHVADPALPQSSGPLDSTRTVFPVQSLAGGECYEAYFRGSGAFLTATLDDRAGTGNGPPHVLVRTDRSVVWLENGSQDATPFGATSGVTRYRNDFTFGFPYTLQFKAFAGVDLCWRGPGRSNQFAVQITVAGVKGGGLLPEQMRFVSQTTAAGHLYRWSHVQGPTPVGYALYGSKSTQVAYYHRLGSIIPFVPHRTWYSSTVAKRPPQRLYVFQTQPSGDPTRVGPFGSWKGL